MSRERKERDQKRGGKYNVDNIDDRGRGIVDFIPCMNYPSNVEFFKTEKGERYVFDFVPYDSSRNTGIISIQRNKWSICF